MLWLTISIISYFLFAIVSLIDETLLSDRAIKPKVYAFYAGILSSLVLFLLFFDSTIPSLPYLIIALISGALWMTALIGFFESLKRYELSRVVPAIGAFLPVFTLGLSYLYKGSDFTGFSILKIISFILLLFGGVLIVLEKNKKISRQSLKLTALTALLFALSFFTAKIFYLNYSFISGLIWIRFGWILSAIALLIFPDVRKNIFKKRKNKKINFLKLFFSAQIIGVMAGVLQNFAIYLAPIIYLSFVNALEGIKYVFVLIFVLILARFYPRFSFEKITRKIIIQKAFAVILIIAGLILLTL